MVTFSFLEGFEGDKCVPGQKTWLKCDPIYFVLYQCTPIKPLNCELSLVKLTSCLVLVMRTLFLGISTFHRISPVKKFSAGEFAG